VGRAACGGATEVGQLVEGRGVFTPVIEVACDQPAAFDSSKRLGEYLGCDTDDGVWWILLAPPVPTAPRPRSSSPILHDHVRAMAVV
jgi:hypothetical protein